MAQNTTEVVVGGAVLAVAAAFVLYAGQVAGLGGHSGSYTLHGSFRTADGIGVGTDVRLAGVKVGTVTDISLNPQTFFADATISVPQNIQVPVDSSLLISSEGLLGGNFVEIQPGGALENVEPGGEIEDTQGSVSLISLLLAFVGGKGGNDDAAATDPVTP
ncbi:outer membrane lipid asymmetry maintenance protein MlaD [Falsirhodobacter sp. 20TX0035]|uniref:outer membrane lipid asymmetry maintenance protein MlaD n=1 Tax=Falsirhodobacter sp. 20TX0035 TaxID=3022019 RepID=UPI00232D3181|nr:outer membrane lipid asymmetry maintenance protein MlaD [Falsirhodobacter sp. 20TX0035]MDB6453461.1 outer membrane lipid asymmetry maintenance protein MlaD [Falsirhodobacter sp. 20TX0035]